MAKLDIFDYSATKVGEQELAESIFNIEINKQAIFDAVLLQQASWRQGTHSTKTRSEVSGGGKKPFKQKGTGNARQGSIRATQFRHGAIAFGPKPRTYGFKLNRKVRQLALLSSLSDKAQNNAITLLDSVATASLKTKDFAASLNKLGLADKKVLIVLDASEDFENAYLAARNLGNVLMLSVEGLNVYDLQNANHLVLTKTALARLEEVFGNE